ncbi:MAG: ribosome maturation factor RimM [Imperialibacter sp.]|uniref:ribosome maturation factor RimM n=1 Tax=Imperialibacter sp. TaxID=2038411 RepID=UPI0032EB0ECC
MHLDDCFQLGVITKTHGTKGDVQVWIDSDNPGHYKNLESVLLLINNELVPFFLEHWSLNGKKAIARFDEVRSLDAADKLAGTEVYLPESSLPELSDGQYFFHNLVGLEAVEDGKVLGTISNILNFPGHDVLAIDCQGKEVLVPISDDIIKAVDLKAKSVTLQLPPGLLDIYLDS